MTAAIAAACLIAAVPGLLQRRFGVVRARLAAAVALAILFVGALNPTRDTEVETPGQVVAVTTGPGTDVAVAELQRIIGPGAELAVVEGDEPIAQRAARAWLSAKGDGRAVTLAVVWTGPFARPDVVEPLGVDAVALSGTPAPPIEPEACQVMAIGPFEVERPAGLEIRVAGAPIGTAGRLIVRGPQGETVHEEDLPSDQLAGGSAARSTFTPAASGVHRFRLELEVAGTRLEGEGSFDVAPAQRVWVIGRGARPLAAALKVQGVITEWAEEVPDDLSDVRVLVLSDAQDTATQERLARFADDGGGVLLVGGVTGGALPSPGEPLDALLPVSAPPRAAALPGGAPGPGGTGDGDPESAEPDTPPPANAENVPPPPSQPDTPPPEPEVEQPKAAPEQPESTASGDTSRAQLVEGPEVEVDRRTVAMTLVIDRSGSMSLPRDGISKMGYAIASAQKTAEALKEGDLIAVVTFGRTGVVELPLTPVTEREMIQKTLGGLRAMNETTLLADGLNKARRALSNCDVAVRHIVVISDGEIYDADNAALVAHAALKDRVTVSLIQIGGERYARGQTIARLGGGKFYAADTAKEIPRLVSAEVTAALGKVGRKPGGQDKTETTDPKKEETPEQPPEEEPNQPPEEPEPPDTPEPQEEMTPSEPEQPTALTVHAVQDSPLLAPLPSDGVFPTVGGVLPVEARPEAQVLLVARQGDEGVPLLAFANRGLGKVGVWTSGLMGEWGGAWRDDADFPARLAQWVSSMMPPLEAPAPGDLLAEAGLTPVAPVAADREALRLLTGEELRPVQEFVPPGPQTTTRIESRAPEIAGLAMLALVLMVVVEWLIWRGRALRTT